MYFRKKYIEKYDLQESYNNFKIKLKISFCESGPWLIRCSLEVFCRGVTSHIGYSHMRELNSRLLLSMCPLGT